MDRLSKLASDISEDESGFVAGTLEYLAPELLEGTPASFTADWWCVLEYVLTVREIRAYGVVLFEMICGFHPFYSSNPKKVQENILAARLKFPTFISNQAASLLTQLLTRNPASRLAARSGGMEIRRHKFYEGVDFVKCFKKELPVPFIPDIVC